MVSLGIGQCKKTRAGFFLFQCIILVLAILISIEPTYGISDIHNKQDMGSGNFECLKCHPSHQISRNGALDRGIVQDLNPPSGSLKTFSSTQVIGNITLITSIGQNWYQQGIYGPNTGSFDQDKSWGWTFFDESPSSGFITSAENVTQRNGIYALLLDSGNDSSPITGAQVISNITYWEYDGLTYENKTISIQLNEDPDHVGLYNGSFNFYGGTQYMYGGMDWCDGCHLSYYSGIDTQVGYFPGNYSALITATADGKTESSITNFEVTPWGCEDCHGSGNQHRVNQDQIIAVDMDSACYLCHGITQITHDGTDAGNPHQNTAHRNIKCTDCHTNKSLNAQTFNGVTFINGGINNGKLPQYNYDTAKLNGGTHNNLTCTACHNDLALISPQGVFKQDNYTVISSINNGTSSFASLQEFHDYYVINVTSGGSLNVSLNWSGTSNIGFYLYPPNFNPRNRNSPTDPDKGDRPFYEGSTFTNKPENYVNLTPRDGNWILEVFGYDLIDTWIGVLQPQLNYTINSTYPIQKKSLPLIPECNSCHNSIGDGKAYTTDNIPDWNPGFAHVDTNNDGTLDIQCRMCHDAMHEITIKDCHNCHTTAPANHPVKEPDFAQKTSASVLNATGIHIR